MTQPTPEQLSAVTTAVLELRAELKKVRLALVGIGDAIDGVRDTLVRSEYGDGPGPDDASDEDADEALRRWS